MGARADGPSAVQHVPEQQQEAEGPGAAQNEAFQQDQNAPASEEQKEHGQTIQVDDQDDGLKADEKVHSLKEQCDDVSAPTETPSATGSKEDGHCSKAEVPHDLPGNDAQHTEDDSHASTTAKCEVKPETQKHDQQQRGTPEQATDKSDRQLSPRDDKIPHRDRHTHSSTLAQERSHQPSKHRSKHDPSLESPKHRSDTRSKNDNSPRAPHSFPKGSSPKTHSNSRTGFSERSQAEKDPSLPAEPNKKRAREHGTTDYPEEKHVKSDKHVSSSRGNQQSPKALKSHAAASSPADDRRRGSSHSLRRPGDPHSEGGSEHRKRHSEHHKHNSEKHVRKLADDGKDRFLAPAGGQHAATAAAEGSRLVTAAGADTAGGNIAKAGKEKKVATKVHLSFDEELDEGGDTASLSAFSLGASTASRFQQERQKANARPAPPVAAPSVQANNLRVQVDDDGFGQGIRGKRDKEPDPCLGRVYIGVAQAKVHRPYMEDRHTIVASYMPCQSNGSSVDDGICRCFAAVYDGHNGCHAADAAASRLHLMIASDPALRMYSGSTGPPSLVAQEEAAVRTALCRAFREIDDDILRTARAESLRDGSTALLVLRLGQVLYAAHAGDSRAVLCRGGLAERLTEDHKPNRPVERHRILSIGGRVEFQRCWRVIVEPRDGRPGSALAVSRSLGDLDFKEPQRLVECEPDVSRTQLQSTDTFVVLATDGLWDMLGDQDAVDCAKAAIEAQMKSTGRGFSDAVANAASEALLQEAIRRGTMDNTTVIVLLLQWD